MRRPALRRLVAPIAVLMASGCAVFGGGDEAEMAACPAAQVLEGSERLPGPSAPPEASLAHVAMLGQLESSCRFEGDAVEVDLAFSLTARGGPGRNAGPVPLPYFVATVAPDGAIRSKDRFTTELAPGPGEQVGTREELTLRVPFEDPGTLAGLRVLIGFQIPRNELEGLRPTPRDLFLR